MSKKGNRKNSAVFICVIAFILAFISGCGSSGSASTKEGTEGLEYEASNGSYIVTGYSGSEVDIVIPDTYNEIPVTGIYEEAFYGSDIQSVVFGINISSIGEDAFHNASLLKTLTFNKSQVTLGESAFFNCSNLENITFNDGSSFVEISPSVFSRCASLTSVNLSEDMTTIPDSAFSECSSLHSIKLPESITTIGKQAFYGCTSLEQLTIPASVSYVGPSAFRDMTSDQKIIIEGSTDGWPATTYVYGTKYGDVSFDQTWNADCNAQIEYKNP